MEALQAWSSRQVADWRQRCESAQREAAELRHRARALLEEKDAEIAVLRVSNLHDKSAVHCRGNRCTARQVNIFGDA